MLFLGSRFNLLPPDILSFTSLPFSDPISSTSPLITIFLSSSTGNLLSDLLILGWSLSLVTARETLLVSSAAFLSSLSGLPIAVSVFWSHFGSKKELMRFWQLWWLVVDMEGTAHDVQVFENARTNPTRNFPHPPTGHFAASGGLLRDDHGHFLSGFLHRAPQQSDSLSAELWAVLLGLKMAWDKGARRLFVESDAAKVITLLREEDVSHHPDVNVIIEIKEMTARQWDVEIVQIPRSPNKVADFLAKHALNVTPGYHLFTNPFGMMVDLLQHDNGSCCTFLDGLG